MQINVCIHLGYWGQCEYDSRAGQWWSMYRSTFLPYRPCLWEANEVVVFILNDDGYGTNVKWFAGEPFEGFQREVMSELECWR